jgi:NNP family nitrate/nitrite transporter-like MFS transporter
MGYVYGRTQSYAIGLWMLSATAALTLLLTVSVVRATARRASAAAGAMPASDPDPRVVVA